MPNRAAETVEDGLRLLVRVDVAMLARMFVRDAVRVHVFVAVFHWVNAPFLRIIPHRTGKGKGKARVLLKKILFS